MPVDLDVIFSASSPMYAFVENRYSFHANENYDHSYKVQEKKLLDNHVQSCLERSTIRATFEDVKPCPFQNIHHTSSKETPAQQKLKEKKKKVSFADDKGLALVEIRSIPQSPKPSRWVQDFFSVIRDNVKPKILTEKKWKIAFSNPPYASSAAQEQLDNNLLMLDNVSVDEGENDVLSGKIKVKNTSFVKDVIVRITYDRWLTYEDIQASYMTLDDCNENENQKTARMYDTFQFSTVIQPSAFRYEVVEFCVCYRANGRDCWDNNQGINYRLVATPTGKTYKTSRQVSQILSNRVEPKYEDIKPTYAPINDCFDVSSEIESWKDFLQKQPYW